jgi:hypothetical protein
MNRPTLHVLLLLAGTLSLAGAFIDIWAPPSRPSTRSPWCAGRNRGSSGWGSSGTWR